MKCLNKHDQTISQFAQPGSVSQIVLKNAVNVLNGLVYTKSHCDLQLCALYFTLNGSLEIQT